MDAGVGPKKLCIPFERFARIVMGSKMKSACKRPHNHPTPKGPCSYIVYTRPRRRYTGNLWALSISCMPTLNPYMDPLGFTV